MLVSGLKVRVATRLADVADALARDLSHPRADPFAIDLVAVPGPGAQRWLAQRLSQTLGATAGDGVCAGVEFPVVSRFLWQTELEALRLDPLDDPWREDRLAWTVMRAFDACAAAPWFAPLASYLRFGDDERPGRRLGLARRVARLFRTYGQWRPELLERVADPSNAWQPPLWAAVAEIVGEPAPWERRRQAVDALVADPSLSSAPEHVHVLAPERLSPGQVEVLGALAAARRVTVSTVVASATAVRAAAPAAPLNAALGRAQVAATQVLLAAADDSDELTATEPGGTLTLLQALQREVRLDLTGTTEAYTADGSVQLHVSHGPDRQVEVMRDVLAGLLQDDPTLEPRDVLVVTPQLGTFAPLVRALCTLDESVVGAPLHPANRMRFQVTDRSLRQANPVLDVLDRVLELTVSRAGLSELLALCGAEPVARRFGLDADALESLADLTEAAGIRWGVDAGTRRRFGLEDFPQGTWLAGLERLLLGVTLSEADLATVGAVLPLDSVESSDVPLVGALAEVTSEVRRAVREFATPATVTVWAERFRATLDALVSVSAADSWQLGHAQRLLAELAAVDDALVLSVGEMRSIVTGWLTGRAHRAAVLTGALTVTSLDALRHVPHRVVCILGLDEGTFPRPGGLDGDDLLSRTATDAEPHPSRDDRQAFLDAVMAATETLVVIFRGRDPRTNDELPVPVPVLELQAAAARLGGGDVWVQHALHPHEPATADRTFDVSATTARTALARARVDPPAASDRFATTGLPPLPATTSVTVEELADFYRHPVKDFLRARIGSWWDVARGDDPGRPDTPAREMLPVDKDFLVQWGVTNRMLGLAMEGHPYDAVAAAEWRRGELAPRALGDAQLGQTTRDVEGVLRGSGPYLDAPLAHLDLGVTLPGGVRLSGRVPVRGDVVFDAIASWPKGRRLITPWVRLLLLAAAAPGREWRAVLCGKGPEIVLRAPAPDVAVTLLADLVVLRDQGRAQPLPLPPDTAYAMASSRHLPDDEAVSTWRREVDPTWRLYVDRFSDLQRAAQRWGGLRETADRVYGPMVAARESA